MWGWGDNSYRQIGDGTAVQRTVPTLTRGIPAMTAIAAGALHTLALATDGTVWAWGDQTNGKLGNGVSDSASASPQRVSGLTNVVAIAAGSNTSLALRKDGSVWIWGLRISSDDTYDEIYPAKVPGLANVSSISSGLAHVLTAKTDGTVWAWGLNIEGGLGDGTYALHEDNVAVINEAYTNLLDLDLTKANLPVDPTKLPPFFAASQKTGGRKNTSLAVNLRGLLGVAPLSAETPGATAQSAGIQKAQTRATRSYNVYVAASVPNGKQTLLFQLEGTKGWNALVWPMNEYLRGVQLDTQDNVVRTQIFQDADLSGLGGATVYMGYGLDAEEMARAGRFRVIFTVPKN